MSKRAPGSNLNADNWDAETPKEEQGTWSKASEGSLKQRVILRAKRRGTSSEGTGTGAFGGLSSKIKTADTEKSSTGTFSFEVKKDTEAESKCRKEIEVDITEKDGGAKSSDHEIIKLNQGLLKWISGHIEEDPICDLRPIFADYDNHMNTLDKKYGNIWVDKPLKDEESSGEVSEEKAGIVKDISQSESVDHIEKSEPPKPSFNFGGLSDKTETKPPKFNFGDNGSNSEDKKAEKKPMFSFGAAKNENNSESKDTKPAFSFGSSKTEAKSSTPVFSFSGSKDNNGSDAATEPVTKTGGFFANLGGSKPAEKSGGFSFGSSAGGFSFNAGTSAASKPESSGGGDEEYKPPVVEETEFEDSNDALYQKKAKIFYMKDGGYKEIGVGQLFIKPLPDNKASILVRADNTLGNILLNVAIPSTPAPTKTGKNNCLLPVVINPPIEGVDGAVPLLIRVKTSEDADKLIEIIQQKQ